MTLEQELINRGFAGVYEYTCNHDWVMAQWRDYYKLKDLGYIVKALGEGLISVKRRNNGRK